MQEHVMQAIYEHARSVYPNESCGFVVLSGRKVRYLPCDNVADSPLEGFVIAPQDMLVRKRVGKLFALFTAIPMCQM